MRSILASSRYSQISTCQWAQGSEKIGNQARANAENGWEYVLFNAFSLLAFSDDGKIIQWFKAIPDDAAAVEDIKSALDQLRADFGDLGYEMWKVSEDECKALDAPSVFVQLLGRLAMCNRNWYKLSWAE